MKVGKLNCRNRPIGKQKPEQILTAEDGYYTPAGAARRARAFQTLIQVNMRIK
jgi:hypothetical protein